MRQVQINKMFLRQDLDGIFGSCCCIERYYTGSEEAWKSININNLGNDCLSNATIHYNSQMNDEQSIVTGDIDQDGDISNTDVVTLARSLAGLTKLNQAQMLAVDVKHDGRVDNADLVMLARAVAGLTELK